MLLAQNGPMRRMTPEEIEARELEESRLKLRDWIAAFRRELQNPRDEQHATDIEAEIARHEALLAALG